LLDVDVDCEIDELTPTTTIANAVYTISVDGAVPFIPTYSVQTEAGCPLEYDVQIVDNGVARNLTPAEQAVLTIQDNIVTEDGRLIANTADFGLHGEVWKIKLSKKSTRSISSNGEAAYNFDLEFKDPCYDSVLQAATIPNYTFDL